MAATKFRVIVEIKTMSKYGPKNAHIINLINIGPRILSIERRANDRQLKNLVGFKICALRLIKSIIL